MEGVGKAILSVHVKVRMGFYHPLGAAQSPVQTDFHRNRSLSRRGGETEEFQGRISSGVSFLETSSVSQ
jgi:hypothetical protein